MCHGSPWRSTDSRIPPASDAPRRWVCAYASGTRISVITARAAAIASGLPKIVPPVATRFDRSPSGPLRWSRCSAIAVGRAPRPEREAARDRLADDEEVGIEAPLRRQPARTEDLGVGLVDREQRAGLAGQAPELGVEAVVGEQQADVVGDRRLGQDDRDVAPFEGTRQRRRVVERDEDRADDRVARGSRAPRRRPRPPRRARPAPRRGARGTCRRTSGRGRGRSRRGPRGSPRCSHGWRSSCTATSAARTAGRAPRTRRSRPRPGAGTGCRGRSGRSPRAPAAPARSRRTSTGPRC